MSPTEEGRAPLLTPPPATEALYRNLFATVTDAVLLSDAEGRYLDVNAAATALLGYPRDELLRMRVADVVAADPGWTADEYARVLREGPWRGELELRRRDGTRVPVDAQVTAIELPAGLVAVAVMHDASGRKQIETLRRSLEQLIAVSQGIADGIIVQDANGRMVYVNDAAARLMRYPSAGALLATPAEDVIAKFEIMDEAGRRFPLDQLPGQRALRGEQAPPTLLRYRVAATGEERWAIVRATPIFDRRGHVRFAVNVLSDITQRRQAEEDLRLQKSLLEAQSEAALDGILMVDRAGKILSFNRRFIEMWGIPAEVISSRSDAAALRAVEDNLVHPEEFLARIAYLYEHPDEPSREEVLLKDGRTFDRYSAPVRSTDGAYYGRVWFFRDITERKRREEAERFLAEANAVLVSSLDYEETLASVARLAVPQLADWCAVDLPGEDEPIRRLAVAAVDPAKEELVRELRQRYPYEPEWPHGVPKVLRTGDLELVPEVTDEQLIATALDAEHLRILRALGMRSYLRVPLTARDRTFGVLSLVSAESGRRYGLADLALAQELARRAALAVDNARLYHEAQQALQVREEFLAGISHDLKTPLTTIKAYAQILAGRAIRAGIPGTDVVMEALEKIDAATTKMTALVVELLDVARLQSGQPLELGRHPTDLVALVRHCIDEQQKRSERHHISLAAGVPELIGTWDALRLERVITNLLANAVKYSPDGGEITVTVGPEMSEEPAGGAHTWAMLAIRDEGLGIPARDLPHIFERFRRGANVAGRFEGTGIGLAAARQIVEQHGGAITVESNVGRGSTFTVRLPLG